MPGRVGVHLVALGRVQVLGGQQQPGAERHGLVVRARHVLDVEVEVNLLGAPVRHSGGT